MIQKGDMLKMGYADFDLDAVLQFYWNHAVNAKLREQAANVATFIDTAKRRVFYRFVEPATRGDDEIRAIHI